MPLPWCPVIRFTLAPLLLLVCLLVGEPARAETLAIYFKTSLRFELVRPFADPANLSVLVTQTDGRPLAGAAVRVRLDAPPPGRVFSTDFPIVEGTQLLDLRLPLTRGRAEWKYLFPIRGMYRLSVEVIKDQATLDSQTFTFNVRENETKWLFLSAFLLGLFVLGVLAGRIFTATSTALLAAITLVIAFGTARALVPVEQNAPERDALEVSAPTVGKLSHLRWRWAEPSGAPSNAAVTAVTLAIVHLEKQKIVFGVDRVPSRGEFAMDFQFPDGAEYRIEALSETAGRLPVHRQKLINVTGVEPPVSAALPALALFIAVIAAGLWVGRWTKVKPSWAAFDSNDPSVQRKTGQG